MPDTASPVHQVPCTQAPRVDELIIKVNEIHVAVLGNGKPEESLRVKVLANERFIVSIRAKTWQVLLAIAGSAVVGDAVGRWIFG